MTRRFVGPVGLKIGAVGVVVSSMTPLDAAVAGEALSAGAVGNIYSDAGVATIQNANATVGDPTSASYKPANCVVIYATSMGATVPAYAPPGSWITGFSGLTPGAPYYLDVSAGGMTATPPATAGNGVQPIGFAISATDFFFFPQPMTGTD